ncbi:hypothetical protein ANTRET_LOCUS3631 [Anthophora retusa]
MRDDSVDEQQKRMKRPSNAPRAAAHPRMRNTRGANGPSMETFGRGRDLPGRAPSRRITNSSRYSSNRTNEDLCQGYCGRKRR